MTTPALVNGQTWWDTFQVDNIESLRVFSPRELIGVSERLELSCGTVVAQSVANEAYVPGARIPLPVFRPPSALEANVLSSTSPGPHHRLVAIVPLFDDDSAQMIVNNVSLIENVIGDTPEVWADPVIALLLDFIESECIVRRPLYCHGVARSNPGLHTVTFDQRRNALLGLHFDNWEKLTPQELPAARNRICINLGPGDRYFVFFNLHVAAMQEILTRFGAQTVPTDPSQIGTAFMNALPAYPVVRLRVRPGEAYIAPTEFVLHDGSSAGATAINHQITLRGYFGF